MGLGAWPWSGPGILSLLEGLFKPLSLCSPHMPSLSNLPPTLQTGLRLRREETGGTWELGDSHAKLAVRSIRSEREGCRDGLEPGEEGGRAGGGSSRVRVVAITSGLVRKPFAGSQGGEDFHIPVKC